MSIGGGVGSLASPLAPALHRSIKLYNPCGNTCFALIFYGSFSNPIPDIIFSRN